VLAAWLVFELTASDPLAAVAFCSKLGWDDWLTAIWLFRRDPRRCRAVVCAWFFIASGLWKTTVSSFVAMLGLIAIHAGQGPPAQPPEAFGAVVLSLFISFGSSSLLTFAASWLAFKRNTRAWVESRVHRARRDDAWPPTAYCQFNRLDFLLVTSLIAVGTPAMLAAVLGFGALVSSWTEGAPAVQAVSLTVLVSIGVLGLITAIFALGSLIGRHVTALTPEGCWGETPDEFDKDLH
jgi:hypothetical protein